MFWIVLIAAIVALVVTGHTTAAIILGVIGGAILAFFILVFGAVASAAVKQTRRVNRTFDERSFRNGRGRL